MAAVETGSNMPNQKIMPEAMLVNIMPTAGVPAMPPDILSRPNISREVTRATTTPAMTDIFF